MNIKTPNTIVKYIASPLSPANSTFHLFVRNPFDEYYQVEAYNINQTLMPNYYILDDTTPSVTFAGNNNVGNTYLIKSTITESVSITISDSNAPIITFDNDVKVASVTSFANLDGQINVLMFNGAYITITSNTAQFIVKGAPAISSTDFAANYGSGFAPLSIDENKDGSSTAIPIGSAAFIDGDNASYSLISAVDSQGNAVAGFTIANSSSRAITYTGSGLDADINDTITLTVAGTNTSTEQVLTVTVNDLNDVAPSGFAVPDTVSVSQGAEIGDVVLTLPIAIPDVDGDAITYSMSGDTTDAFYFDASSRELKVNAALDVNTTYNLTFKAEVTGDDASPANEQTVAVTVLASSSTSNLTFSTTTATAANVIEGSSDIIVTTEAIDSAAGSTVRYSLTTGGKYFKINDNGEISLRDDFDLDNLSDDDEMVLTVTVRAFDGIGEAEHTIDITVVADDAPFLDNPQIVVETNFSGDVILTTDHLNYVDVNAVAADNTAITYTLEGLADGVVVKKDASVLTLGGEFTQQDVIDGKIVLTIDEGKSLAGLSLSVSNGVQSSSVQDFAILTRIDLYIADVDASNTLDYSDNPNLYYAINAGDGRDVITGSSGDEVITAGRGDDKIALGGGGGTGGRDTIIYEYDARTKAASDGGDVITGFRRGEDSFMLSTKTFAKTETEALEQIGGTDKESFADDQFIIMPDLNFADGTVTVLGITFIFRHSSVISTGRLSSNSVRIEFDEAMTWEEFLAAIKIGDDENFDYNHLAVKNAVVLPRLLGEGGSGLIADVLPTIAFADSITSFDEEVETPYTLVTTLIIEDDLGLGHTYTYSIEDDTYFTLDVDKLYFKAGTYDADEVASYTAVISATTDDGDPGELPPATFTVTINDINDEKPVINSEADGSISDQHTYVAGVDAVYTAQGTPDVEGTVIAWSLKNNGTSDDAGLFSINGNSGKVTFNADTLPDNATEYRFTIIADAGDGQTAEREVTLTATDLNDVPILAGDNAVTLAEGAEIQLTEDDLQFTDVDNTPVQIVYTVKTLASGGTLAKDEVALEMNATFTQQDVADGKISYTHNGGEDASDSFTYSVSDDANTTADQTFTITVTPVNDAPFPVGDNAAEVAEGAEIQLTEDDLQFIDVDNADSEIVYRVNTAAVNGDLVLRVSGSDDEVLAANATFTQQDIATGKIVYKHAGGEDASDSFTYNVSDDTAITAKQTFNIDVSLLNDAPVLKAIALDFTINSNDLDITEDDANDNVVNILDLDITDVDDSFDALKFYAAAAGDLASLNELDDPTDDLAAFTADGVTAIAGKYGHFNFTHTAGANGTVAVSYVLDNTDIDTDGLGANDTATDTVKVRVYDADGLGSSVQDFTVNITGANDAPVSAADNALTVGKGDTKTLTAVDLGSADVDNTDSEIIYTVNTVAEHGNLQNDGAALTNNTFTMDDVAAGKITYVHGGGENTEDGFTYSVSDGTATIANQTFNITVIAANTAPVQVNSVAELNEGATKILTADDLQFTDVDGDTVTYTVKTLTTNGTLAKDGSALEMNATFTQKDITDGKISYAHNGGEVFTDGFTYSVSDGTAAIDDQSFAITVTSVNDAPVSTGDNALKIGKGDTKTLTAVDLGFTDADNTDSQITYTVKTAPTNGSLQKDGAPLGNDTFTMDDVATGKIAYVHNDGEDASDSFTYSVSDGADTIEEQTFAITVTAVNSLPALANSAVTLAEGAKVELTANDLQFTDGDGDAITYTVKTLASNGSLQKDGTALAADGTFTQQDIAAGKISYTHNGDEDASDSFTYSVSDGTAIVDNQTFTITVTALNDAPVLGAITLDTTITGNDFTVTENDANDNTAKAANLDITDADDSFDALKFYAAAAGDLASLDELDDPTDDLAAFTADGVTAIAGKYGHFNFTHTAGEGGSVAVSYVLDNTDDDTNALGANDAATDTVKVRVYDADGLGSSVQDFTVNITGANDAPVSTGDNALSVGRNTTKTLTAVDLGSADPDNTDSQITYTVETAPTNGSLRKNGSALVLDATFTQQDVATGKIAYRHNGGDDTSDSFAYSVFDGTDTTAEQTFNITVIEANTEPVLAGDNAAELNEGGTVTLTENDLKFTDDDGDTITYVVTRLAEDGSLKKDGEALAAGDIFIQKDVADGKITYVHAGGEIASDTFTYGAFDGTYTTADQTFTITVTPVNDAPVLANSAVTLAEGDRVTLTAANLQFTDAEDDTITYTIVTVPSVGTLKKATGAGADGNFGTSDDVTDDLAADDTFTQQDIADGKISYTHNGGEDASDSFTYSVFDGAATIENQSFAITVTPVNDAPVLASVNDNADNAFDAIEETEVTLTEADLQFTDVDNIRSEIVYKIESAASVGSLKKGGELLAENDTFTQQDIFAGTITYLHDGSQNLSSNFTYSVSNGEGTDSTSIFTFYIAVQDVDDAPMLAPLSKNTDETKDGVVENDSLASTFKLANLSVQDDDNSFNDITFYATAGSGSGDPTNSSTKIIPGAGFDNKTTIVTGDYGEFQFKHIPGSLSTVQVTYVLNNSDTDTNALNVGDVVHDVIKVIAYDDDGESSNISHYAVKITGANDALKKDNSSSGVIKVTEGGEALVTKDYLRFTDVDNTDSEITYTITDTPIYGDLFLREGGTDTMLGVDGTFTQQDINDEKIVHIHGGEDHTLNSFEYNFNYKVSDGVHVTNFNNTLSFTVAAFSVPSDTLDGTDGDNTLDNSFSEIATLIQGGNGDDTIIAGSFGDVIAVGQGADSVTLGDGADIIVQRFDYIKNVPDYADGLRLHDGALEIHDFKRGTDELFLVDTSKNNTDANSFNKFKGIFMADTANSVNVTVSEGFITALVITFAHAGEGSPLITINFDEDNLQAYTDSDTYLSDDGNLTNYDYFYDLFGGSDSIDVISQTALNITGLEIA